MDINIELEKVGLKRIINFQYNVSDCLFNAIAYLLKYSISSKMRGQNNISYLKEWHT
jgi:hypothetical protein